MGLCLAGPWGCGPANPGRDLPRTVAGVPAAGQTSGLPGAGTGGVGAGGGAGTLAGQPAAGQPVSGVEAAGVGGAGIPTAGSTAEFPPLSERVFDAGSEPDRNQVSAPQVCERMAAIQCAGEYFCCENPGRSVEVCEQAARASCEEGRLHVIAQSDVAGFDEGHASQAFAQFETLASTCELSVPAFAISQPGFAGMFKGTLGEGESCMPPAAQLTNLDVAGPLLAACMDNARIACLPGLLSWRCEPRADVDSNCLTDANCLDGIYCDNPGMDLSGRCAARKDVGTPCMVDNECQTLLCRGGACAEPTQQNVYCLPR